MTSLPDDYVAGRKCCKKIALTRVLCLFVYQQLLVRYLSGVTVNALLPPRRTLVELST